MDKHREAIERAKGRQSKYLRSVEGKEGEIMRGIHPSLRRKPAKKY